MAGMSSLEQTRRHIVATSVDAVGTATLSDLLAFLTPARIAQRLDPGASIKVVQKLVRVQPPATGFVSSKLGAAVLKDVCDGFAAPSWLHPPPSGSFSAHLNHSVGEHFEHVFMRPGSADGRENLALLALGACRSDPDAQVLLERIERTQRHWLEPRLVAAGATPESIKQLVTSLSMVRYGQILAVRRTETSDTHQTIRLASLLLSRLLLQSLSFRDREDDPLPPLLTSCESRDNSDEGKVVQASFDAIARAEFEDAFAWLTAGRVSAFADVDRKTVAYHFPRTPGLGAFDRGLLLEAIERAVFVEASDLSLDADIIMQAAAVLHYVGAATRHRGWLARPGMSRRENVFADLANMQRTTSDERADVAAYMVHIMCSGNDAAVWQAGLPHDDTVRNYCIPLILEAMSDPVPHQTRDLPAHDG